MTLPSAEILVWASSAFEHTRRCTDCQKAIVFRLSAESKKWMPFDINAEVLETFQDDRTHLHVKRFRRSALHWFTCEKRKKKVRSAGGRNYQPKGARSRRSAS